MQNTNSKITSLLLICFIGQILAGCNSGSNIAASTKYQTTSLNKQQGIGVANNLSEAFDEMNSDQNVWANVTLSDIPVNSQVSFLSYNHSNYPIQLVGCESPDDLKKRGINTNNLTDLNNPEPKMIDTSLKFIAQGFPEVTPDPLHVQDNRIEFNRTSGSGSFRCYYSVYMPEVGDSMYIAIENNYYVAQTSKSLGYMLDGPQKENAKIPDWIKHTISVIAGIGSGLSIAYYMNKRRIQNIGDLSQLAYEQTQKSMLKIAEEQTAILKKYPGTTKYARIQRKYVTDFYNDMQISKNRIIQVHNNMSEALEKGLKGNEDFIGVHFNPDENQLEFILEDDEGMRRLSTQIFDANGKLIVETKPFPTKYEIEQILTEARVKPSNPQGLLRILKQYDARFDEELYINHIVKHGDMDIVFTSTPLLEGLDSSEVIDIAFFSVASVLVSFAFFETILSVFNSVSNEPQGQVTTGMNHVKLVVADENQAKLWNASHDKEHQIKANTTQTTIHHGMNGHWDTFSFKANSGNDMQKSLLISLSPITEPFFRPTIGQDDAYLGNLKSDKAYDAVIAVNISSSNADNDKNQIDDFAKAAASDIGLSGIITGHIAAPNYKLSKITNTKTNDVLYNDTTSSKNNLISSDGWNNIKLGSINGLTINSNQEVSLQVMIPKEGISHGVFGGEKTDKYGIGFVANYIDESGSGAIPLMTINGDDFDKTLQKEFAESPQLAMPYLYSKYECTYPTKIGDECGLKMHIGGMDSSKHIGKIYIADGSSRTTAIPVYLNYHLLGSYFELNVSDKTSPYKIDIMNTHNEAYTKMTLEYKSVDDDSYKSVPMDMLAKATTCNLDGGLQPQTQCSIYFDFSKLDSDTYQFRINGIKKETKLGTPDQFDVRVRID